jgi:methylmalonyl-CoA mutase cobalamin-binding subunit
VLDLFAVLAGVQVLRGRFESKGIARSQVQISVSGIFQPGTAMDDIVKFIRENVKHRGKEAVSS